MALEYQIAEILATILTATASAAEAGTHEAVADLLPLYDDLRTLCEFNEALQEFMGEESDEEMDEPGRPTPLRLNAFGFTETGANACEGGEPYMTDGGDVM